MRKLVMAVMTVAGLGLAVGCQDRSKVQQEKQDVAEAQRDVAQTRQRTEQEVAEARQEGQQELGEARQDVLEEQRDVVEAQQDQAKDQREAMGGSGTATAQTEEVKGTIQSASATSITLIVPDKNNQMMRFQVNQQVQVMKDDKPVALSDLKPGDEVRASYQMDPNGQKVLRGIDVKKESAQHPDKQKK
ncbi:hypothetical protein [Archangium sp.]|uniref:hypothetical protein n=1 Tax=Archangium sp. TaxID=1872627 RepID=UPI002D268E6C|nr:hypothetical protein [Archangium sp.]HYO57855.1 hypothetical protein [Archangium sp.]